MARPAGVEPTTTCLEGRCSIQLSYGRTKLITSMLLIYKNAQKKPLYPYIVSHMI